MEHISAALTLAPIQRLVNGHAWFWPLCETIHYVGMSLLVGIIGVLDLRILGLFRSMPIGALKPLVPLAMVIMAMSCAWQSVGKPGKGSVSTRTGSRAAPLR